MTESRTDPLRGRIVARTFASRLDQLKNDFVGRGETIDLIGLAMLCREHVLLIGPPGTAKTALLNRFGELLDSPPFTYLLSRFTEPAELFGPLDVHRFQHEGEYRVNTDGMLPQAHLAFLDEVFQGSSAILNTLLTLINDRRFHNGATVERCNLITLLGATNEVPDDPVLAAFGDRFLLRCRLEYVADDEIEDLLAVGWSDERRIIARSGLAGAEVPRDRAVFSMADLRVLQQSLAAVDLGPVSATYARIIRDLREQGAVFSDRRAVKAQKVIAASALLAGRAKAEQADLAALVHVWADGRDEAVFRRVVTGHGVPVSESGHRVRDLADIRIDLRELLARQERLAAQEEYHEVLRLLRRLATEVRNSHPAEGALLKEIQDEVRGTITRFRERYREELDDV
ncbi:MoxR-like ATPase [Catenulispora sp. GP43]|uniref:AAA family ATPase n=1 Tax=Catenulispora sp. GP43 TaxID=3156263 RepID=UPI0035120C15